MFRGGREGEGLVRVVAGASKGEKVGSPAWPASWLASPQPNQLPATSGSEVAGRAN